MLFSEYEKGNISDTVLVQLIEQAACYLNLKTITNYAKSERISYNGAKKRNAPCIIIDHVKFIINNE